MDRMSSVEGTLNLDIVLPGGKQIRMDVDARYEKRWAILLSSVKMFDIFVHICYSSKT